MSDDTATTAPLSLPTTKPPPKPGFKTSEFYAAWFVKILGALLASGILGTGTPAERIAGGVMALLAQLGYTGARTLVKTAPALVLLFALALAGGSLTACGASQQQTTMKVTTATIDTARAAWFAYDRKKQDEIIESAKTKDEAKTAFAVWRKEEATVVRMINTAYTAVGVYSTLKGDETSLQNLNSALGMLEAELVAIGAK